MQQMSTGQTVVAANDSGFRKLDTLDGLLSPSTHYLTGSVH